MIILGYTLKIKGILCDYRVIFKIFFKGDYSEPWGILNGEPQITQITTTA